MYRRKDHDLSHRQGSRNETVIKKKGGRLNRQQRTTGTCDHVAAETLLSFTEVNFGNSRLKLVFESLLTMEMESR